MNAYAKRGIDVMEWIYPVNLLLLLFALLILGGAVVLYVRIWTSAHTHLQREMLITLTFFV